MFIHQFLGKPQKKVIFVVDSPIRPLAPLHTLDLVVKIKAKKILGPCTLLVDCQVKSNFFCSFPYVTSMLFLVMPIQCSSLTVCIFEDVNSEGNILYQKYEQRKNASFRRKCISQFLKHLMKISTYITCTRYE